MDPTQPDYIPQPKPQEEDKRFKLGKREVGLLILVTLALIGVASFAWQLDRTKPVVTNYAQCVDAGNEVLDSIPEQCEHDGQTYTNIATFEQCVAAGNPVMESYPEQCAANGQSWTNPLQSSVTPPEIETIPFAGLPSSLQQAIISARGSCTGVTLSDDELNELAVAEKEAYIENKYARVSITCGDGGASGLFVYRNENWVYVGATQYKYLCSDLVEYEVPRDYIEECTETGDSPPVPNPVTS